MLQTKDDYGLTIHNFSKNKFTGEEHLSANTYYSLHLVTNGNGYLQSKFVKYEIEKGCIFMSLPHHSYIMKAINSLEHIQIDFIGLRGVELAKNLLDVVNTPVFEGYDFQIEFWEKALKKWEAIKNPLIAEGVLYYTLGSIPGKKQTAPIYKKREFIMIQNYIRSNFTNSSLSLEHVAKVFGYNKKYLSDMFKRKFDISFSDFLKNLRLENAVSLMRLGHTSVSKIATTSGFNDPLYFSKLFKKTYGLSPKNYVQELKKQELITQQNV